MVISPILQIKTNAQRGDVAAQGHIDGSPPGSPSLGFKAPEIHQLLKCAQRSEKAGYCDGEKKAEEMQEAQEGERWKYKERGERVRERLADALHVSDIIFIFS